jgi:hypothetical protein
MIDTKQNVGAEKLVSIFGSWPDFHDAEIMRVRLDCAPGSAAAPSLELVIHAFRMTSEVDAQGYFVLADHSLVTLRFSQIEALSLNDFREGNVVFSLNLSPLPGDDGRLRTNVDLTSSYGMHGEFTCDVVEVVSVTPCDESGRLLA